MNMFNVAGYGAKGDGKTDDTAAIQRAIEAAQDRGGGIVYFPDGGCYIAGRPPAPPNPEAP